MISLKNKHIVIIGASSGMGKSLAELCQNEEAKLSLCARRELSFSQENIKSYAVDIQDKSSIEEVIKQSILSFGEIDFLINCAGVMYYQSMENRDYANWIQTVQTNVIGFLNVTYAALPSLIQNKGMFVNITSDAGRQAFPGLAIYSGSKAFMEFTLKSLRLELVEKGVRIINIQPGNVATPLQNMSTDKAAFARYASNQPEVFLQPENIAKTILFAMKQPEKVAINEILIEPQQEPI